MGDTPGTHRHITGYTPQIRRARYRSTGRGKVGMQKASLLRNLLWANGLQRICTRRHGRKSTSPASATNPMGANLRPKAASSSSSFPFVLEIPCKTEHEDEKENEEEGIPGLGWRLWLPTLPPRHCLMPGKKHPFGGIGIPWADGRIPTFAIEARGLAGDARLPSNGRWRPNDRRNLIDKSSGDEQNEKSKRAVYETKLQLRHTHHPCGQGLSS
jgi:hypothetical protein